MSPRVRLWRRAALAALAALALSACDFYASTTAETIPVPAVPASIVRTLSEPQYIGSAATAATGSSVDIRVKSIVSYNSEFPCALFIAASFDDGTAGTATPILELSTWIRLYQGDAHAPGTIGSLFMFCGSTDHFATWEVDYEARWKEIR